MKSLIFFIFLLFIPFYLHANCDEPNHCEYHCNDCGDCYYHDENGDCYEYDKYNGFYPCETGYHYDCDDEEDSGCFINTIR